MDAATSPDRLNARVVDLQLSRLGGRIEGLDSHLGIYLHRFEDRLDTRLDVVEGRLDAVEVRLSQIQDVLAEVLRRLPEGD